MLRRRLGLALGVRLLVVWVLVTIAVALTVRHELNEIYDGSLLAVADAIQSIGAAPPATDDEWRELPNSIALEDMLDFRLREQAAALPINSLQADEQSLAPIRSQENGRAVQVTLPPLSPGGRVRVVEIAHGDDERGHAIIEIVLAMLVPALVVIPIGLYSLRSTLIRELAPLDSLASQIDRRDGYDLSPVSAPDVPGELRPLLDGVNQLLSRLRRALDAERDFAGIAAHELRTPLAGALAQTQRLLVETEGPVRERMERIELALHHLQRLIARLLELTRAEGAGTTLESKVDLAPTIEQVVKVMFEEHESGARILLEDDTEPLYSHLDPDAFSVLLRNLLENALVHGAQDTPVHVRRRGRIVDVENTGPVLASDELERVQKRFVRGTGTAAGTGLGLTIVQAIVSGGAVDVDLSSPCPGRSPGLLARVTLL